MSSLKRTYQVESKYTRGAKRARVVAVPLRTLALRKPEVKDVVFNRTVAQLNNTLISVDGLFKNIAQGSSGSNRVGDQIRVLSIEISGRVYGETALDATFAVVRPNDAMRVPLVSDWATTIGGLYDHSRGWIIHQSFRDIQTNNVLQKRSFKFPLGLLVKYEPGQDGIPNKNEVYLCHINNTGANATAISYSVRVRFVDV